MGDQHTVDVNAGDTKPAPVPLRAGVATSVGSLPHDDALDAALFVLDLHRAMPAAPELPGRTPLEGMIAQWAVGIPGVAIDHDTGSISVDPESLDPTAPVDPGLEHPGMGGLHAFLDLVSGRTDPVKLQITGPVTLGRALLAAGAPRDLAFAVAGRAIGTKAAALLELARDRLPEAPLLVVLDEPGFTGAGTPDFPLAPDVAVDLLSTALAGLEGDAVTGVHCCGPTDLRLLAQAGAQVLSLPAGPDLLPGAAALAGHLEQGGWVAWGAVPTSAPLGTEVDPLWRRLTDLWCDLVRAGCDPARLRTQALITPECGLAGHGVPQARRILELTVAIADRVGDQAAATRLSVGA